MAVTKRKDGRWQVVYRNYNQKLVCKCFKKGAQGKKDAYAHDAEIKAMKAAKKELPDTRIDNLVYLDDLTQQWVDAKKAQGKKLRWIGDWVHIMNKYILPELTKKPARNITQGEIVSVIINYWGERSQSTKNRYTGYLKSIFQFGVDLEILEKNPLSRWKPGKEQRRKSSLTFGMLKRIKECAPCHLCWAIEVMWNVPIRPGPVGLFALTYENSYKPERQGFDVFHEKVNKRAFIKISDEFNKRVQAHQLIAKSRYIIEYKGNPVKDLGSSLTTLAQDLGYPHISMYDIRHCWITYAIDKGLELSTIAHMAGTSVDMLVKNYYEPHAAEQQRATEILKNL